MEEERARRTVNREDGAALVVVLVAIVILLPPTLVLATLSLRWQKQSLDFRDMLSQELAAQAMFEEARARLAGSAFRLGPNEDRSYDPRPIRGLSAEVRISRAEDVVVTLDGRLLEGAAANGVDLEQTGMDAAGRVVYQLRRVEIYLVQIDVVRRPSLPPYRLYGVVGRLPDGRLQTLGITRKRGF